MYIILNGKMQERERERLVTAKLNVLSSMLYCMRVCTQTQICIYIVYVSVVIYIHICVCVCMCVCA